MIAAGHPGVTLVGRAGIEPATNGLKADGSAEPAASTIGDQDESKPNGLS
jgi:hypothetical protein